MHASAATRWTPTYPRTRPRLITQPASQTVALPLSLRPERLRAECSRNRIGRPGGARQAPQRTPASHSGCSSRCRVRRALGHRPLRQRRPCAAPLLLPRCDSAPASATAARDWQSAPPSRAWQQLTTPLLVEAGTSTHLDPGLRVWYASTCPTGKGYREEARCGTRSRCDWRWRGRISGGGSAHRRTRRADLPGRGHIQRREGRARQARGGRVLLRRLPAGRPRRRAGRAGVLRQLADGRERLESGAH
jgi:hypothetical protein